MQPDQHGQFDDGANLPDDLTVDHEQFAGEEIPDPWDDPSQTDWPQAEPILDPSDSDDSDDEEDAQ